MMGQLDSLETLALTGQLTGRWMGRWARHTRGHSAHNVIGLISLLPWNLMYLVLRV